MDDHTYNRLRDSLMEAAAGVEARVRTVPADRWEEVIQTGGAWTGSPSSHDGRRSRSATRGKEQP